jgi:hypothetical protein
MQADVTEIHDSPPRSGGYIEAMKNAVRDWKHDCSPAVLLQRNWAQCKETCTHLTYANIYYTYSGISLTFTKTRLN